MNVQRQMSEATQINAMSEQRLFVAAPMSGFSSEDEYAVHRQDTTSLVASLRREPSVESVYYAGENTSTAAEFMDSKSAFLADMAALNCASAFIFLYPVKVLTSALVEVGVAIGQRKPVCIIVNQTSDLPYLLREVESHHSASDDISFLKVVEARTLGDQLSVSKDFIKTLASHRA